jgi:glycerol-3-phosphate dehydrogenase
MKRFIENFEGEAFDVIVIGGGITGASIAYDAATRGLKVALVEKKDFSWATSSVTSKLIHGGLRYLANGELGLVRESLRERRVLENIAPNFVYPTPIMMTHSALPITNRKRVMKVGMLLYDMLSYDKGFTWDKSKKVPYHRSMSKDKVLLNEPNVRRDRLTGASIFYDCTSIFPERLTLAFIKSAVSYGAKAANYTVVNGFLLEENRVTGVKVTDAINGVSHEIRGKVTINCGGPWADIILGLAKPGTACTLRRSEGIHIITEKKMLSGKYVVGTITPKGRHFFLIPWRNHTLIGTTDKPYSGSPDDYRVTKESIIELINEVNMSFGDGSLSYDDVRYAFGGLRPLVEEQTEETYSSSRKYEIFDNMKDGLDGLVTVEGGKYTTSRNLAENCMNLVMNKLGLPAGVTITDKKYLWGSEIKDMNAFMYDLQKNNRDFSGETMEYLGRNYGTECYDVMGIARAEKQLRGILDNDGEILAQVSHAVRNEMAQKLSDIVLRRTGIATLGNPGNDILEKVAVTAGHELHWDSKRIGYEIEETVNLLRIPAEQH